jgi:hypothetical protein
MSLAPELIIQAGDDIQVHFHQNLPVALVGTFIRWFPSETATSFHMITPSAAAPVDIIYVKDYAYVTKTYVAP